jgi:hypothetical protein
MLPTRRRPTAVLRNFPETRWDVDRLFDEFFGRPMATMNPAGPEADFYLPSPWASGCRCRWR